MKAWMLENYGGAEGLRMIEAGAPSPGRGEVLVRVHASSIDPGNVKRAAGAMRGIMPELEFPWVPGAAVSGVVEAVGEGVDAPRPGDAVYGYRASGGAFAESMVVEAGAVAAKPQALGHAEAAALAVAAQTAQLALDASRVEAGQRVLILGAGGAVGGAALQLAKVRGAQVLAVCRTRSVDRVVALGADVVIDGDITEFESVARGVDVVLDTLGGDFERRALATLRPDGILVAVVQEPSREAAARHGVRAVLVRTQSSTGNLEKIAPEIESGRLRPSVGRIHAFDEIPRAWSDFASRAVDGKIVIDFTLPRGRRPGPRQAS